MNNFVIYYFKKKFIELKVLYLMFICICLLSCDYFQDNNSDSCSTSNQNINSINNTNTINNNCKTNTENNNSAILNTVTNFEENSQNNSIENLDFDRKSFKIEVGIYDDTTELEPGAWIPGLDYIQVSLENNNLLTKRISRQEINSEEFDISKFKVIIFGGGFAYPGYTVHINEQGKKNISEFVSNGGNVIGICAGAYFFCNEVQFEGNIYGDESGYDLDFFNGKCSGTLQGLAPYPEWNIVNVKFNQTQYIEQFSADQFETNIWYAGGPYFIPYNYDYESIAVYKNEDSTWNNELAVILVPYENGKVILFGPHPEVIGDGVSHLNRKILFTIVYKLLHN